MKVCGDTELARELNLEELGSIPRYATAVMPNGYEAPLGKVFE